MELLHTYFTIKFEIRGLENHDTISKCEMHSLDKSLNQTNKPSLMVSSVVNGSSVENGFSDASSETKKKQKKKTIAITNV